MNEQEPRETGLSTADLAAGMDRRSSSQMGSTATAESTNGNIHPNGSGHTDEGGTPLLDENKASEFRSRWDGIQASFVDEPRKSVEQADTLVAEAMQHLAQVFSDERSKLENQWSGGGDPSTDDLRLALQRYRTFFHRLLSI
jgi:hypothetical protein